MIGLPLVGAAFAALGAGQIPAVPVDSLILKQAQTIDDRERGMYPFIRQFKSLQEAIAKFNRI